MPVTRTAPFSVGCGSSLGGRLRGGRDRLERGGRDSLCSWSIRLIPRYQKM